VCLNPEGPYRWLCVETSVSFTAFELIGYYDDGPFTPKVPAGMYEKATVNCWDSRSTGEGGGIFLKDKTNVWGEFE